MSSTPADYSDWIGRSEERFDVLAASPLERLAATLDRDDPPVRDGDAVPPLAHWLYFLPRERQSMIGADGHAARGGFLPPIHDLPRRMWAGGRLVFHRPLRVGAKARRLSRVAAVTPRSGKTGPLVFVTVRHEIGETGGPIAIAEEHDIVYRGLGTAGAAAPPQAPEPAAWRRSVVPDATFLFRYSALTFNGHRIHYDRQYVTQVEGYPGLLVHGPLIATLLADLLGRHVESAAVKEFSFRAVSPALDGEALHLNAAPPDADGRCGLWAAADGNRLVMRAEARVG